MKNLIPPDVWDEGYKNYKFGYSGDVPLGSVLLRHISTGESCFEIGCFPGNFLRFLYENKKCKVSGIDITSEFDRMVESFDKNQVSYEHLVKGDVLTLEPFKQFDTVLSFGFIEHFDNPEKILKVHDQYVVANGKIIVAVPNFRYLQFIVRKYLNSGTLEGHNLKAMDVRLIEIILSKLGYSIDESGYYGTCLYWYDKKRQSKISNLINRFVSSTMSRLDKLFDFPNKYTAPYIYVVARKK